METLKEILKNTKEYLKLYEEERKKDIEGVTTYDKIQRFKAEGKTDEEIKKITSSEEWRKKQDEEIKNYSQLKEDLKINRLQRQLLKNKLVKEFLQKKDQQVIETLKKYENKNIGEKTKEKINEEIKAIIKDYIKRQNSEVYVHFGFNNCYESAKSHLSVTIREQGEDGKMLYDINFKYEFYVYNNQYTDGEEKSYMVTLNNCYYLYSSKDGYRFTEEDASKKNIKRLLNESKTKKAKIDKLLKQAAEIRHELDSIIDKYSLESHDMEELKQPYEVRLY